MDTDGSNVIRNVEIDGGRAGQGQMQHQPQVPNNCAFKCINYVFGFGPDSPKEATGLSLDIVGRATVAMSSTLLGPALLQLASEAAGCAPDSGDKCANKVYGMRPSSLMTNIAAISGVIVCVMLPIFGSIIDHTKYRRQVGIYTAIAVIILKGIETAISSRTWFLIACLQVFLLFLYNIHLTTAYAYISELSSEPQKLSRYNSSFYTSLYIATVVFLIVVIGIGMILDVDDVGTARISQILVTVILIVCWSIAWLYYLPDRPAASKVPNGMSVISAGCRKLYRTLRTISANNMALSFFLISVAFSEAASFALITVSTTYMKVFLYMDATQSTLYC
jgi:MFS-type transporter involved in bile tolerance (Atg22 family)